MLKVIISIIRKIEDKNKEQIKEVFHQSLKTLEDINKDNRKTIKEQQKTIEELTKRIMETSNNR